MDILSILNLEELPEKTYYYGNIVYKDGRICDALGKEITVNNGKVRLTINGEYKLKNHARLLFEAFACKEDQNFEKTRSLVIEFKENAPHTAENLWIERRTDAIAAGRIKQKSPKFDKETIEKIRREYHTPYIIHYSNGREKSQKTTPYKVLADRYNCSESTIYKIVSGYYPAQKPTAQKGKGGNFDK